MGARGWFAIAVCWFAASVPVSAQIVVDNLGKQESVRQSAVLIRGRSSGTGDVIVARADGEVVFRAPVVDGRFVALVGLRAGKNVFRLSSGKSGAELALDLVPATSPYRVRVVYVVPADGGAEYITQRANDPQNYEAKLDTLAKCLQAFTAESLRDAGFGRTTFHLETDDEGRVVVHTLRHTKSRASLQALADNDLYGAMHAFAVPQFDAEHDKILLIMGFSGYDTATKRAKAHTALGGGALGVFSNLCMHSWPDSLADVPRAFTNAEAVDTKRVFEDVGLRDLYHLASTTMGAVLHEMGHTFGLPHTSDPRCIMSRGFDHLHRALTAGEPKGRVLVPHPSDAVAYWSPAFALRLAHSPWFLTDPAPPSKERAPSFESERDGAQVVVEAPAGIAGVSVQTGTPDPSKAVLLPLGDGKQKKQQFDFDALRKEHALAGPVVIHVYDRAHRLLVIDEQRVRHANEYLRRWQIGAPRSWDGAPPALPGANEVARWVDELAALKPVDTTPDKSCPFLSVDLYRRLGGAQNSHVLLRTTVPSKRARPAVLLFGGDDGVRIWVNGTLVLDRVEKAVFGTDSVRAEVDFVAGENNVVVQSFQAGGGWGLSLRVEYPER